MAGEHGKGDMRDAMKDHLGVASPGESTKQDTLRID
jgi:hypothetical protein